MFYAMQYVGGAVELLFVPTTLLIFSLTIF